MDIEILVQVLAGGGGGGGAETPTHPLCFLPRSSIFFRSLSVILAHSACAAPPRFCKCSPTPMQIIRAEVAAGGELGTK